MADIDFADRNALFILGVERSGSTWLANIIDSSPAVELYMEPFAEAPHLFRGFPDRLTYLGGGDAMLERRVRDRFEDLRYFKFYGFDWPSSPTAVRKFNWWAQNWLDGVVKSFGGGPHRARTRYRELNLNRFDNPETVEFEKSARPELWAVKELRLNFKVPFLCAAFPEATFLVIVRNPLTQIESMMRLFDRDDLIQLKGFLEAFPNSIEGVERLSPFDRAMRELDDSTLARAVAYWFTNYSVLLEDLEASVAPFRVVRHEELARRPRETSESLFEWLDLEFGEQTTSYLSHSTSGEGEPGSATDTTRDSKRYVERSLHRVSEARRRSFFELAEPFWELAPEPLAAYRDWLHRELPE